MAELDRTMLFRAGEMRWLVGDQISENITLRHAGTCHIKSLPSGNPFDNLNLPAPCGRDTVMFTASYP